jgi:hypothetical protein
MRYISRYSRKSTAGSLILLLSLLSVGLSQQQADLTFDASVAHPAYTTTHPKVLFDEAHNNFHTAGGRYKPFADLITNDGYQVIPNKEKFRPQSLQGYDILVISNAFGSAVPGSRERGDPAFAKEECDAVRDWVQAGGSLLLIADHAPAGAAAANLASRVGVDMSKGFTADPPNHERVALDTSWIRFSRANKNLGEHPITRGRDMSERINSVLSFTGQSLKGPRESTALLKLSPQAYDVDDQQPRQSKNHFRRRSRAGTRPAPWQRSHCSLRRSGHAYGAKQKLWHELSGNRQQAVRPQCHALAVGTVEVNRERKKCFGITVAPNKSSDASGESVFRIMTGPAVLK